MKLVFVSNQYAPNIVGGAEIVVQGLAEQLLSERHDVTVISLSPTGEDTRDVVNGVRVYRIAVRNIYYPFGKKPGAAGRLLWHARDVFNTGMAAKVGEILGAEHPDWVSTQNLAGFSVSVWREAKSRGISVAHTMHDYYLLCPKATMSSVYGPCGRRCVLCAGLSLGKAPQTKHVDVAIGVSSFVLRTHVKHGLFSQARKSVVYNGQSWAPLPPEARPAPNPGRLKIGFIGRVQREKGIEVLLEAIQGLSQEQYELIVAGRPENENYIERLKSEFRCSNVSFVGYVKAADFYRSVDVVVVPSIWDEPLPGVAYEPLGFGRPVIASRVGGIPEILEQCAAAELFPAGDSGALREALEAFRSRVGSREIVEAALERRRWFEPASQAKAFLAALNSSG